MALPHLVTVSGQKIRLRPGARYTLGRAPECNVVLQDRACSRRHAVVSVDSIGERVWLEDTSSRNGTFLNGLSVTRSSLVPDGGQIRLGSTIFILSYRERPGARPDNETVEVYSQDTLFLETSSEPTPPIESVPGLEDSSVSGIAGKLSSVSITDVLQLLSQMGRSGTLEVELAGQRATVEVRLGRVLSARIHHRRGMNALHELVQHKRGKFRFVENDAPCPADIELPTPQLLLELCRILDESSTFDTTL